MSSGSSSDRHRRRHKKKHRRRHRSNDSSVLQSIRDELQSISNRVARMEELSTPINSNSTVLAATPVAQSAERSTRPNREQSLPASTIANPTEEQSTSTMASEVVRDVTDVQSTGNNAAWADRDDGELPDYGETIYWEPDPDSEDPDSEVQKLSATTSRIVQEAFSHSIPNERRRNLKRKLPTPDTPHTKCPKLDPAIQSRLPKHAKDADRNLARLQTLVLDAAAPLINTLEAARVGSLTTREAAESAQLALKLLGNASANISIERRHKATTHLNPELSTLVQDEGSFKESAPLLFGKGFDQLAKEHIEAIKSLKKTTFQPNRSFQRSHPPQSRGGGTSRGRGIRKFNTKAQQPGKRTY